MTVNKKSGCKLTRLQPLILMHYVELSVPVYSPVPVARTTSPAEIPLSISVYPPRLTPTVTLSL